MIPTERDIHETSPRTKARITGVLFLILLATAIFAQGYVAGKIFQVDDAAATGANVLAQETLLRLGYAAYLVEMSCQVATTALLYDLLKPAGRGLSLLAAFFGLTGSIIKTLARLFFIAPLLVLKGGPSLDPQHLQGLSLLSFRLNNQAAGMALVFLGISTILQGWLILRSTFLPRALGALSLVSGTLWLSYLYGPLARPLFPVTIGLSLLGLLVMVGWFLVVGVDEERWKEQAARERTSIWA
ncbi:MAG: DUF4386 domain-containing protein [Thermoanaerobaculia bacterium]